MVSWLLQEWSKKLGGFLIDIHGQHEHQSLLDRKLHIDILDGFIDQKGIELKRNINKLYNKIKDIDTRLKDMKIDDAEKAREIDLLEFQINEIEEAGLKKK